MHTFENLSDASLSRLLREYERGLEAYARGEINYPCGVSWRTVARWVREVRALVEERS